MRHVQTAAPSWIRTRVPATNTYTSTHALTQRSCHFARGQSANHRGPATSPSPTSVSQAIQNCNSKSKINPKSLHSAGHHRKAQYLAVLLHSAGCQIEGSIDWELEFHQQPVGYAVCTEMASVPTVSRSIDLGALHAVLFEGEVSLAADTRHCVCVCVGLCVCVCVCGECCSCRFHSLAMPHSKGRGRATSRPRLPC
jgi:hypothetical protein